MKITKQQLRKIIREEKVRLMVESKASNLLQNMDLGMGYEDAQSLVNNPLLPNAANAIISYQMGMEDIAMAPAEAISEMFNSSALDDVHDLSMQATGGDGYDPHSDVDSIRGFMIGLLELTGSDY